MASQWLRRGWLVFASASAVLLAACGGGSVESEFTPARIVAFGDAMADVGQNGRKYTVNDGAVNNWTEFLANAYGRSIAPVSAGGTSYATGNARISARPDAGGSAATRTVTEQVDAFMASATPGVRDLYIFNAGMSDLIVEAQAVVDGTQSGDQMLANVEKAATELADQVRRVVKAGGTHVLLAGPINLGRTPWALDVSQTGLMESATRTFNNRLLVSLVDLGDFVLYVDAEREFNLYAVNPSSYDMLNAEDEVCNSIDAGAGIGTGSGQVNSNLCGTSTVRDAAYDKYLFADRVYPTPRGHRLFGDFAQARIKERW